MPKNETYILQQRFFEYIETEDIERKQDIIEKSKKELPSSVLMIDRLKKIIDSSDSKKETKIKFINNVCDVANNTINIELLENMESQNENKTIDMSTIKKEMFNITRYDELEILNSFEEIDVIGENYVKIGEDEYFLTEVENYDLQKMNYLIGKLLGFNVQEMLFAEKDGKKFIISKNKLPRINDKVLKKEECLCDKKTIWLKLENEFQNLDTQTKNDYIKVIFLDVITNQNFRNLRNGVEILESDMNQNEYYVLNDVTIKKEFLIISLFENYYETIIDIANLINDNHDNIMNLLDDLAKNSDERYFNFIKENITMVHTKRNIKIHLEMLDNNSGEIYTEERIVNNEQFKYDLDILKKSFGLKSQILTKSGYAGIYTIVLGIITFGVCMAYLMLAK